MWEDLRTLISGITYPLTVPPFQKDVAIAVKRISAVQWVKECGTSTATPTKETVVIDAVFFSWKLWTWAASSVERMGQPHSEDDDYP